MEPHFHEINMQTWPRAQVFHYFSRMAPTGYSLTVDMDVTKLREALKDKNKKFFPAYLYLVTKKLNEQIEFKVAEKDGITGYWDTLTPLFAAFHEDDKTFSLMWCEYDDSFNVFYERYIEHKAKYGDTHGILSLQDRMPPENCYTVSCIPWIEFKHFAIHSYGSKPYYFPTAEAGKFHEENGKMLMPLSLTLHHAATDGYHVNKFLQGLQQEMDQPDSWINR